MLKSRGCSTSSGRPTAKQTIAAAQATPTAVTAHRDRRAARAWAASSPRLVQRRRSTVAPDANSTTAE
ncbi:hypothetical protein ACFQ2B_03575 [Streptomyces stramineus]